MIEFVISRKNAPLYSVSLCFFHGSFPVLFALASAVYELGFLWFKRPLFLSVLKGALLFFGLKTSVNFSMASPSSRPPPPPPATNSAPLVVTQRYAPPRAQQERPPMNPNEVSHYAVSQHDRRGLLMSPDPRNFMQSMPYEAARRVTGNSVSQDVKNRFAYRFSNLAPQQPAAARQLRSFADITSEPVAPPAQSIGWYQQQESTRGGPPPPTSPHNSARRGKFFEYDAADSLRGRPVYDERYDEGYRRGSARRPVPQDAYAARGPPPPASRAAAYDDDRYRAASSSSRASPRYRNY